MHQLTKFDLLLVLLTSGWIACGTFPGIDLGQGVASLVVFACCFVLFSVLIFWIKNRNYWW